MANAGYVAKVIRNWDIPQGADTVNGFRYAINGDFPLMVTNGWQARAQIRSEAGGEEWATFLSSSETGPRIELTDEAFITIILPHNVTEDSRWDDRYKGFYDLELIRPDGFVIRLAKGEVNITHDYTRIPHD